MYLWKQVSIPFSHRNFEMCALDDTHIGFHAHLICAVTEREREGEREGKREGERGWERGRFIMHLCIYAWIRNAIPTRMVPMRADEWSDEWMRRVSCFSISSGCTDLHRRDGRVDQHRTTDREDQDSNLRGDRKKNNKKKSIQSRRLNFRHNYNFHFSFLPV